MRCFPLDVTLRGVSNAIAAMLEACTLGRGRSGVIQQTQGSGKSLPMVFFTQKVLRKVPGNWSLVVVTDRNELDDQIAESYKVEARSALRLAIADVLDVGLLLITRLLFYVRQA